MNVYFLLGISSKKIAVSSCDYERNSMILPFRYHKGNDSAKLDIRAEKIKIVDMHFWLSICIHIDMSLFKLVKML